MGPDGAGRGGGAGETAPLPCVSTAFAAKTAPLPCVSTAFAAKTAPFPRIFPTPSRLRQRLCPACSHGAGRGGGRDHYARDRALPARAGVTAVQACPRPALPRSALQWAQQLRCTAAPGNFPGPSIAAIHTREGGSSAATGPKNRAAAAVHASRMGRGALNAVRTPWCCGSARRRSCGGRSTLRRTQAGGLRARRWVVALPPTFSPPCSRSTLPFHCRSPPVLQLPL